MDDQDECEETQNDVHMRIAANHQDVVYQLYHKHCKGLPETDKEGQNGPFKLPRVIQGEFHVFETLSKLCLYVDVENKSACESCKYNLYTHWLHFEVEKFVNEDDGREKLCAHQKDNCPKQRSLPVLAEFFAFSCFNKLLFTPAFFLTSSC